MWPSNDANVTLGWTGVSKTLHRSATDVVARQENYSR